MQLHSISNLGARWSFVTASRPGRFIPGKDPPPAPVLIKYEQWWAPKPGRTFEIRQNFYPCRDSNPEKLKSHYNDYVTRVPRFALNFMYICLIGHGVKKDYWLVVVVMNSTRSLNSRRLHIEVCLFVNAACCCLLRRADHSPRGVLLSVGVSLWTIVCNNNPKHWTMFGWKNVGLWEKERKKEIQKEEFLTEFSEI